MSTNPSASAAPGVGPSGLAAPPGAAARSTAAPRVVDITLNLNGQSRRVGAVDPSTPLLYVLRDELALNGAKFGCGLGQCGACTVMVGGEAVFSCLTPVSLVGARPVKTVEGLGSADAPGPLQRAFIDEQAAQCGYCIAGMVMRAQALLERNPSPTDEQIRRHMSPNLCRCGTHLRILRAVRRAADGLRSANGDIGNGSNGGTSAAAGTAATGATRATGAVGVNRGGGAT